MTFPLRTTVVSAYVPVYGHPRSEQEYDRLGQQLLAVNGRMLFAKGGLDHCWLFRHLTDNYWPDEVTYSVGDNPQKNTLAYHIVQAQKTEWLEVATYADPVADVFVWIDYGIFHIPGVTGRIIEDFLYRVQGEQAIAIPGCWKKDQHPYDDKQPCWRFCGGVMVVPRVHAERFNMAMKREYMRWLDKTKNVSWETNVLARLEQQDSKLPLWWYQADHDATMFTNYKTTQCAEGDRRGYESRPH
jgi:hypothetical protein